jgi:galactose mutarotase-like enzyme
MTDMPWKNKISNHAQIGGIETSVIDNGLGRGTRIAWVNTGSGLRYKLVLDRAMDIADAFYNQHSLAWISHAGITAPNPAANGGLEWLKTFGGGLLTTCGLTHVGGPETDEYGTRGLHGRISNLPAEIESIIQPDPVAGKLDMSITAKITQSTVFGPHLELKRTISSTLGQADLRIHDEITNRGNTPAPHMMLYHCNFGWPLVDTGTDIIWKGKRQSCDSDMDRSIFNNDNEFRKCPAPLDTHAGVGEACAFIDTAADSNGLCQCGLHNAKLGLTFELRFNKEQLPWLTNWQHWGKGEYVTALEPGTNPPVGQAKARQQNELMHIAPGQSVQYDLEMFIG